MTSHSSRTAPVYSYGPVRSDYETQSDIDVPLSNQSIRSLSPDDINKLKYKIDLDKQVAEKRERLTKEWETKIERDKKYVRNQPFGRHDHRAVLNPRELEDILKKGRAPSPMIEMPQQLPLQVRNNYPPNATNNYGPPPPAPSMEPRMINNNNNNSNNGNNANFQRFYGPHTSSMTSVSSSQTQSNGATAQPIKGDAHDPFILYDPNKEGQNVFNIIPQQDLYDPWGRPGGGAPLVHQPTGQKFTRYSGSLQDKLNSIGPLGFHRRNYNGRIDEQKRDLEAEQRRRQQEDMEHRSNAGDTAEWISHLESSRFPLKLHLPTTETTRQYIGAHDRARFEDSRALHNDLVRQAEERARVSKVHRYQDNIAELNHTEAQNGWWGRSGGGAPTHNSRRHNVLSTFEGSRQRWTTNHLGQLTIADDQGSGGQTGPYVGDFYYPKVKGSSSHRNQYQMPEDQAI